MCGVYCKFFNTSENNDTHEFLEAFNKISHRGPDGEGLFYISGEESNLHKTAKSNSLASVVKKEPYSVALAHKRLSIIDLSEDGLQPFVKDNLVLVFNGEIFNYIELREELVGLDYTFNTSTDTEVVLAAYLHWGKDCFKRFNGMWAISIYDKETKRVILSRDRFGVKPLYYQFDNGLVVSSEMKNLKKQKINLESLSNFLEYNLIDHGGDTLIEGVFQVEPSSYYEIDATQHIVKTTYFDIQNEIKLSASNCDYEELLLNSVKLRNRADVNVGGLLSGGIDSSIIAGLTKNISGRFDGFSSVFDDPKFSEEEYIKHTEKFLDINVSYNRPNLDSLASNVRKQIYIQDSPLRSLAPVYQNQLYSRIRECSDIRVVLNGQGADEVFSGYHEHIMCQFSDLLKKGKTYTFFNELLAYSKIRNVSSLSLTLQFLGFIVQEKLPKFWHFVKPRMMTTGCKKKVAPINLSGRLLYNVFKSALPEYLKYEDRNSMSNGIEARLPFLDYRLVLSALRINNRERIVDGVAKQNLRNFSKKSGLVCDEVLNRKDKTGFVSPQHTYMKTCLHKDIIEQLDYLLTLNVSVFNNRYLKKLRGDFYLNQKVNLNKIFRLYTVALWMKEFGLEINE